MRVGDDDLLDLVAERLLDRLHRRLVLGLLLLARLLLLVGLGQLQAVLGDRDQLLALKLLELLHGVLVDGVDHVQHLEVASS
jgi:hypothetical protein